MMGGLFTWLIVGVVIYLLLSRRGGMMGCCGGHDHHPQDHSRDPRPGDHHPAGSSQEDRWAGGREDIIDLKKEDYHVSTH